MTNIFCPLFIWNSIVSSQIFAQNDLEKYSKVKILLDGKSMSEVA